MHVLKHNVKTRRFLMLNNMFVAGEALIRRIWAWIRLLPIILTSNDQTWGVALCEKGIYRNIPSFCEYTKISSVECLQNVLFHNMSLLQYKMTCTITNLTRPTMG